jgi:hypothetical protein
MAKERNRRGGGPGTCQVCNHRDRDLIDLKLATGQSLRSLAVEVGIHYDAIRRHSMAHLSASQRASLLTSMRPDDFDLEKLTKDENRALLANLVALRARMYADAERCRASGGHGAVIAYERTGLKALELGAKVLGSIVARSEVVHSHITVSADYLKLKRVLIEVLRPYPEIAAQVAAALEKLESDDAEKILKDVTPTKQPALIEQQAEAT